MGLKGLKENSLFFLLGRRGFWKRGSADGIVVGSGRGFGLNGGGDGGVPEFGEWKRRKVVELMMSY